MTCRSPLAKDVVSNRQVPVRLPQVDVRSSAVRTWRPSLEAALELLPPNDTQSRLTGNSAVRFSVRFPNPEFRISTPLLLPRAKLSKSPTSPRALHISHSAKTPVAKFPTPPPWTRSWPIGGWGARLRIHRWLPAAQSEPRPTGAFRRWRWIGRWGRIWIRCWRDARRYSLVGGEGGSFARGFSFRPHRGRRREKTSAWWASTRRFGLHSRPVGAR